MNTIEYIVSSATMELWLNDTKTTIYGFENMGRTPPKLKVFILEYTSSIRDKNTNERVYSQIFNSEMSLGQLVTALNSVYTNSKNSSVHYTVRISENLYMELAKYGLEDNICKL